MSLELQDVEWPVLMQQMAREHNSQPVRCCRINGWLQCFITIDAGLWHLSISHPRRYPTWDEIKAVRYELLPKDRTFAILLPPPEQYVNVHPNCFHLHEVPELHERTSILIPA